MICAVSALLCAAPAPAQEMGGDTFTMALTGDSIITRKLSVYREPEFLEMIGLIREADMAFTNLEMLFHDYEPYPAHQSGGTWMRGDPALAKELVWAGFDMVARANNHTGDYGVMGMRLTTKYVEEAGLVHAGSGESLPEAREARFLDTHEGRVALISVASTFPDHSRAGKSRGDIPARPGLNPLRHTRTRVVTPEQLQRLREVLVETGLGGRGRRGGAGNRLNVFGTTLIAGDEPGTHTTPNQEDLEEIAAVVRSASTLADYTIVTIHAHEGGRGGRSTPADFLVTFARAMIDAGADVMVGHGPHVLRGIEIYRGKPILYSLGDFLFQNETLLRLPAENYASYDLGPDKHVGDFNDSRYGMDTRGFPSQREIWEAVVATLEWDGGELVGMKLHPITLGFGTPRSQRGRPMLATGELAEKILTDLRERSAPFGTSIATIDGVGVLAVR
jgi:poly-gamma-glutamate synthesis protein (capsule biosynthesis protein)